MATGALSRAVCTSTGDPVSKLVLIALASKSTTVLGNWIYCGRRAKLAQESEVDERQAAEALTALTTTGLVAALDVSADDESWVCFPRAGIDLPTLREWWRKPTPKQKPAPILPALRLAVYRRDGFKCVDCHWAPQIPEGYDGRYALCEKPPVGGWIYLTLDHRTPRVAGGQTTFENLDTRCGPCNSSKGTRV